MRIQGVLTDLRAIVSIFCASPRGSLDAGGHTHACTDINSMYKELSK